MARKLKYAVMEFYVCDEEDVFKSETYGHGFDSIKDAERAREGMLNTAIHYIDPQNLQVISYAVDE